jgi:hypothetical protein
MHGWAQATGPDRRHDRGGRPRPAGGTPRALWLVATWQRRRIFTNLGQVAEISVMARTCAAARST